MLQIGTMQLQGMEMCREKQFTPVAANASFQLQGILCVKQLSGSWDTHTAPTSTVRDHRLGSASLEKGLGLGYLYHILLLRFRFRLPPPHGPSQYFLQFMTPSLMEVRS